MAKRSWTQNRDAKAAKLDSIASMLDGKFVKTQNAKELLESVIKPGDKVVLEGDNQKQASFLSKVLASVDPQKVHDLHMIMSSVSRPEHLDIFETGIAKKLDFSFAGPQSTRISQMIADGTMEVGDIHTYLELYARLYVDLIPNVVLVAADKVDHDGNLYTGANTEETPAIVEAAAFKDGIVIVQANEVVDKVPRVDIPGDWVDIVVPADEPYQLEPLFTRDPQNVTELQILMGMMAIRGIYEKHNVQTVNHGVGFNTAAIELLLPTYGEQLGLKGKIVPNWEVNPTPTLIPAIESGWVKTIHSFGGEVGMENYIAHRPDIFFVGKDGTMRSNRAFGQMAGQYALDMFVGSTLQIDKYGNSSTVTNGRLSGFGGAPNMGSNPHGRRHSTPAWQSLRPDDDPLGKGQKLVVQMVETFGSNKKPVFVDHLDAEEVQKEAKLANVPIMIYSEDTTHIVTEEGIAYLYKTDSMAERQAAIEAIAGVTPVGLRSNPKQLADLRRRGIVALPEDLGVQRGQAKRSLLAAQNMDDLVKWSDGLYNPPAKFRSWS
ncbi:malonate decarboxylase subunit alpha [Companilactobacillus pabuli]|jgi:malonate decarboxylase, alpha subunit|uniref:Malonate decarboxylase subunit alpha n=1 Tax=Companilactobacillus pabuli TaxID=2714036 RepID=A0A7L7KV74_9LACO|nr:malonate decarboxylase subunit alpha [Companilactobacillus pabuli]AKP03487.1 malonate decarboxylase subunit alpha [Companilactobacillus farciminis]AKS51790.1 malonate decarboxylase subunit alpha [Companilactobacillus farciminis]MCV3763936.1 malonate decarboxylase subunit alpha [Companilactobacillus farciminis]QMT83575.1 malonate decarboxylase subunit alpha [Companilactobacillus pabuli]GAQ02155.1 malonate decarboxylase subunit alpha [Companilactobacillus farciminis]